MTLIIQNLFWFSCKDCWMVDKPCAAFCRPFGWSPQTDSLSSALHGLWVLWSYSQQSFICTLSDLMLGRRSLSISALGQHIQQAEEQRGCYVWFFWKQLYKPQKSSYREEQGISIQQWQRPALLFLPSTAAWQTCSTASTFSSGARPIWNRQILAGSLLFCPKSLPSAAQQFPAFQPIQSLFILSSPQVPPHWHDALPAISHAWKRPCTSPFFFHELWALVLPSYETLLMCVEALHRE